MAGHFEAVPGGGAAVALDELEISILRTLTVQLLELIGPGDAPADAPPPADPLDALFAEGPSKPPSDPALARLFPDAYGEPGKGPDDEERARSAEFRRYTEPELRESKRENALAVVRGLDLLSVQGEGGAVLKVGPEESRQWLATLNDLRLAIGARLDIRDDDDGEELFRLPDEDERKPMVMAYLWLGGLQETLIETLMG
ncbi:DUF2017 domain-containing protein [Streptomyces sp. WAC 06738]|uniref:DUF2017 domain-containing protein n=1 Tax=Streptomyces sp. WAC 06738 TaxID=2203210 RepID=UPI000F6D334E|nr:DUF2017 domain-containing protein [Streptomyces sp. WAC 06738]AZM46248.1 DUF2017 domain-containing protein [Streptomyces sp. WAC 06738]